MGEEGNTAPLPKVLAKEVNLEECIGSDATGGETAQARRLFYRAAARGSSILDQLLFYTAAETSPDWEYKQILEQWLAL